MPDYGFDLYFLAYTDARPSEPDLMSVTNRPWLWQQPFTQLELQHVLDQPRDNFKIATPESKGEILVE